MKKINPILISDKQAGEGTKVKSKKLPVLKFVLALVLLVLGGYFLIRYAPQLKQFLTAPSTALRLEKWIDSLGIFGIIVLFFLQVLQVFIAVIPSEPIEIAAGISYGGFWGFVICITGVFAGSWLVFRLIRRFGTPFVEKLVSEKKLKEFRFIKNTERLEGITFLLYFIPGLPKDVFTYFAALTPIETKKFLVISMVARIPSILVSAIAGAKYMEGNYIATIVIFGVFALLGIIGMVVYKIVTGKLNRRRETDGKNRE